MTPAELENRVRDLEALVMVLDVTLSIVTVAPTCRWPDFAIHQVEAGRVAFREIMGEESMCRSLKQEPAHEKT